MIVGKYYMELDTHDNQELLVEEILYIIEAVSYTHLRAHET